MVTRATPTAAPMSVTIWFAKAAILASSIAGRMLMAGPYGRAVAVP
jgi:hypothetical protein